MKWRKLEELLKKHTDDDGNIDVKALSVDVNEGYDAIFDKKEESIKKQLTAELTSTLENEFVKGLEIKDVESKDGLLSYLENINKNDLTADLAKMTKRAEEAEKRADELTSTNEKLNTTLDSNHREKFIRGIALKAGINPSKFDRLMKNIEVDKIIKNDEGVYDDEDFVNDQLTALKEDLPGLFAESNNNGFGVNFGSQNSTTPSSTDAQISAIFGNESGDKK